VNRVKGRSEDRKPWIKILDCSTRRWQAQIRGCRAAASQKEKTEASAIVNPPDGLREIDSTKESHRNDWT
jgi:hypothetical protein